MAYDTVLDYLKGTLRYADSPSTIYVAGIKGHPDFVKIGFCQLSFRKQRRADPFIGQILYESCLDQDTTIVAGDLARAEAFLIEQYIHEMLTSYRELIPELDEIKWIGRYETFRVPTPMRTKFLEWLDFEVGSLRLRGFDALEQMLDQLVSSSDEVELYHDLKDQWAAKRAKTKRRLARLNQQKVKA